MFKEILGRKSLKKTFKGKDEALGFVCQEQFGGRRQWEVPDPGSVECW